MLTFRITRQPLRYLLYITACSFVRSCISYDVNLAITVDAMCLDRVVMDQTMDLIELNSLMDLANMSGHVPDYEDSDMADVNVSKDSVFNFRSQ